MHQHPHRFSSTNAQLKTPHYHIHTTRMCSSDRYTPNCRVIRKNTVGSDCTGGSVPHTFPLFSRLSHTSNNANLQLKISTAPPRTLLPVVYNPGGIVLPDIQQIFPTNVNYLYLRVPSCRGLATTHSIPGVFVLDSAREPQRVSKLVQHHSHTLRICWNVVRIL